MFGTAQLPKFADDQFAALRQFEYNERASKAVSMAVNRWLTKSNEDPSQSISLGPSLPEIFEVLRTVPATDQFWLIPTAEVPLTNLVRESIVDEAQLPMRLTA